MEPRDHLLGLIQQLYAAPGTAGGWQTFLESLRCALDGSAASFISHRLNSHQGNITVNAHADPGALRLYNEHWGAADPWAYSPKLERVSGQAVVVGDELLPHRDVQRTAYYQDFARRYDIVRTVAGMVEARPDVLSVISINGSERRGPFGEREVALLQPIVPHVRQALQLHRRLSAADAATDDFASVINTSRRAVFLIAAGGRIVFMNQAASALTAMRDGLTVERHELWASRIADTRRLRALIAAAIETAKGTGIGAGGTLVLGRPSDKRPLIVLVCPVARQRAVVPGVESASAVVFVTDPDLSDVPDEGTLCALFGLTMAEAKLTCLLARGLTLQEAGDRLALRRETIRSRLKTIFEKTRTHRQADLVRLVLSGAPRI